MKLKLPFSTYQIHVCETNPTLPLQQQLALPVNADGNIICWGPSFFASFAPQAQHSTAQNSLFNSHKQESTYAPIRERDNASKQIELARASMSLSI